MLSLIAGLDLGEGLSRQAALLGADGEQKSKEDRQDGLAAGSVDVVFWQTSLLLMGFMVVRKCCNLDRWRVAVEKTSSPDAGRL
jgi:hypothetical protein